VADMVPEASTNGPDENVFVQEQAAGGEREDGRPHQSIYQSHTGSSWVQILDVIARIQRYYALRACGVPTKRKGRSQSDVSRRVAFWQARGNLQPA